MQNIEVGLGALKFLKGDSFSIFQQEVLIGGRELGWGQAFRRGHEKDEREPACLWLLSSEYEDTSCSLTGPCSVESNVQALAAGCLRAEMRSRFC